MKSKGAIDRIVKKYGETNSLEGTYNDFLAIKKDLNILQEIRKTYKVFKDDDEYFLSDGKHLHIIDKKQFDKWNGWLYDK